MADVPNAPVRVRFSARDFDTFFDDLSKRLKDEYGNDYNDFAVSSLGVMLIDLVAWAADQLSWYIDRRATESYLDTAQHRSSISRLTRQLGYAMRPAASSSVDLSVAPDEARDFEWSIPVGFQFQGPNNLIFEVTQQVTWAAGDGSTKTVPAREGTSRRVTTASDGTANQEVSLTAALGENKFLVQDSVRVFVDGAEWTEVEFLTFEQSDMFEVHYLDEPPRVRFGNGIAGNIPPLGAEIRVLFVVGSGRIGNVSSGSIDGVVRPLVARFETIDLTVTNSLPSSGGDDPETNESAKLNAPLYYASRGVAVTEDDYRVLASTFTDAQYGKVAKATAFVARELTGDPTADALITDIQGEIDAYQSTIEQSADALSIQLQAIDTSTATAQTQVTIIDDQLTTIEGQVVAINAASLAIQGRSGSLQDAIDVIDDALNDNNTGYSIVIDDVITILSAEGYATEAASLTEIKNDLSAVLAALQTAKTDIDGAANTIRSSNQTVQTAVDDAQVASGNLSVALTAIDVAHAAAVALNVTIDGAVASHQPAIIADIAALRAHLDDVLAADCKSNVITVPILAMDGDGFYAAPSTGLIRRLQAYLQERSDVAHKVIVRSGADLLVEAHIVVQLAVLDAYTFEEVATDIDAAMKSLLKNRVYNDSLYLHQLHRLIDRVDGVDVANVEITGDADYLDANGNLIVSQERVITYGSIVISPLL